MKKGYSDLTACFFVNKSFYLWRGDYNQSVKPIKICIMKLIKKSLLFLFVCFSFFAATSNAMHSEVNTSKIRLMGTLVPPKKLRSSVDVIQACQDGHLLQVDFLSDLGAINVSIYDAESGEVVHQSAVDTAVEQQLFIDVTSLPAGVYTLEFVDSQDQYLQGDFEI
jgi:hypothetical protein